MAKVATTRHIGLKPDYGAIFMANRHTRHECFERKLFGAPFSSFSFVQEIKSGMLLFLFEYETRKLYGVFQACTDGKLNIVPEAYQKVKKSYPSQVRFKVLWRCKPLSEVEFHGAIEDNYYAPYKFNFGLSKDQVQRLLALFYPKKIIILNSLTPKKGKRKRSKSFDENDRWGMGENKPTLEEGEVENSANTASLGSSFSGTLILPLKKDKKESENIIVSSCTTSMDLEDYIPLPSPEHDDLAESEKSFSGNKNEFESESLKASNEYEDLSPSEECIIPKVFGPKDSNPEPISSGCYKSSPERETKPVVKGLYADKYRERKCVFARLNLPITPLPPAPEEIKDDMQSPDGLMRRLQKSHKKWEKWNNFRKRKEKKEEKTEKNRASVFSRLTIAPKRIVERVCNMKPLERPRKSVFLRLKDNSQMIQAIDKVCLVNNQILSQENSAGEEKGKNIEKNSTKNKIRKAAQNEISEKETVTRNDEVALMSPKTLLTYFRRRRRLSASPIVQETKLSVFSNGGGECANNVILGSEKAFFF